MSTRYYTNEHEWISCDGDIATVGISEFATEELGEIVYVELPETGVQFGKGEEFGTVESVKTVSSLYAPLAGEIVEINETLTDAPETINDNAYTDGWLIKLRLDDSSQVSELMDEDAYQAFVDQK